jgi:hypothetical protein
MSVKGRLSGSTDRCKPHCTRSTVHACRWSRWTHRRIRHPTTSISALYGVSQYSTHAHRARARLPEARNIGAPTPCQTPAQPVSCESRLSLRARSTAHHPMRCTHGFRWKPCRHTTDVIPKNYMHCGPGLTLPAEYYASTLMAHTSNKQMIESDIYHERA